ARWASRLSILRAGPERSELKNTSSGRESVTRPPSIPACRPVVSDGCPGKPAPLGIDIASDVSRLSFGLGSELLPRSPVRETPLRPMWEWYRLGIALGVGVGIGVVVAGLVAPTKAGIAGAAVVSAVVGAALGFLIRDWPEAVCGAVGGA